MKRFFRCAAWLLAIFLYLPQNALAARLLIPVGEVIGISVEDGSVTVAAFDPELGQEAKAAGLCAGDRILKVDGIHIRKSLDIREALSRSDGRVEVEILREGKMHTLMLEPRITRDGPKLGIYLKEGVTGIGTVTWYDPDTGAFAALGHGVNTPAGELVLMESGSAYRAGITSVKKGAPGEPGQLMGALESREPIGVITRNSQQGIFGNAENAWVGTPLPTAESHQIHPGSAVIRATVRGDEVREYSVEILKIYPGTRPGGRNMLLQITDPALLKATGGIVQGMSGSPIIQDGKLVGAVTHVLVNDPTRGYGIFIENMLDAAA